MRGRYKGERCGGRYSGERFEGRWGERCEEIQGGEVRGIQGGEVRGLLSCNRDPSPGPWAPLVALAPACSVFRGLMEKKPTQEECEWRLWSRPAGTSLRTRPGPPHHLSGPEFPSMSLKCSQIPAGHTQLWRHRQLCVSRGHVQSRAGEGPSVRKRGQGSGAAHRCRHQGAGNHRTESERQDGQESSLKTRLLRPQESRL